MSTEDIQSGSVVRYPYLWARQSAAGETEGRKQRPVAVGVRVRHVDGDALLLFAITSSPPAADRWTVEVPDSEKKRAGLDPALRQWIVLDEFNHDVLRRSYYLDTKPPIGRFSQAFFLPVMRSVAKRWKSLKAVRRL